MAKYRKRPIVVEAEHWHPQRGNVAGVCYLSCYPYDGDDEPHVHTLEGPLGVSPGDWIITGIKGEKYPCKPDIFKVLYEPA